MSFEKPGSVLPTGVPDKRIVPPYENSETTKEKYKAFYDLLGGSFDDVDPKQRPTILDFHGLPPESKEEDIIKWIEREMEIPQNEILEDGKTENSAKFYKQLNYAYQIAKDFLVNTLKYTENEVSIGPTSISSKKDILDLLNKTIFLNDNKGLSKALLYCRIVKTTLVSSETLKSGVVELKKNTEDFESSLISHPSENLNTPFIKIKDVNFAKEFYGAENGDVKGMMTSRWKDPSKAMLRFMTRAESDAKTSLKDGIASRIKIDEKKLGDLLSILNKWLTENMNVKNLTIENMSFIPKNKLDEIIEAIQKQTPNIKFTIKNNESNPASMGEFEAITITGALDISKVGKIPDAHRHSRQFEIQIVKTSNRNEKGKMGHEIFDVSKLVSARTRLDGGCPERVFNEFVKDASYKSGISENKIIRYLTESKNPPIIKIKKKNNRKGESLYIANSVYDRWNNFNEFSWVDNKLISDINYSKNK